MNNRISVIVPVYKIEKYLDRCIESIVNQTYKNLEIILVDDGSPDSCPAICDEWAKKDNRIVTIHQANGGVTSARLNGIKNSTGDWIGFVDGDDFIEESMYEFLITNATENNADISHCGYQMVFDDNRIRYFYNTGKTVLQDNIAGQLDLLDGGFVEPGLCNKLFRKSLFKDELFDNLDTSIKHYEDLLMNFYLFKESMQSIYVDKCPYHYMVRAGSASRREQTATEILDPIKVFDIIIANSEDKIKEFAKIKRLERCITIYNTINSTQNIETKKYIREIILNNKTSFNKIRKNSRIMGKMICSIPHLYNILYRLYEKFLQEKKYS